jgi:hypothetical protein
MVLKIWVSLQTLAFHFQSAEDSGGSMVCCAGPALLILGSMVGVYFWSRNVTQREFLRDQKETANMSPGQKDSYYKNKRALASFGQISPMLICPHCQTKGQVRTTKVTKDKGISGGKATGAVLTGGLSVLATGLSRNEDVTQAHCDECNSTWHF